MILYHGSNVEVRRPQILKRLRALDFGAGFYTTSNREQAEKWARTITKRRLSGVPCISVFSLDEAQLVQLAVLKFDSPSDEWLDFVVANRKGLPMMNSYDLVIGPVANDATLPVIDDYMDGRYTKEEAVGRLLPQKLTDQYAFLTAKALSMLEFKGSEVLS
jgi:hypothetical protein